MTPQTLCTRKQVWCPFVWWDCMACVSEGVSGQAWQIHCEKLSYQSLQTNAQNARFY